jgi:hypothetical protein
MKHRKILSSACAAAVLGGLLGCGGSDDTEPVAGHGGTSHAGGSGAAAGTGGVGNAGAGGGTGAAGGGAPQGTPLFGTAHTPNNRPISDWEADILAFYGGSSIVDVDATADLQSCITNSGTWGAPYAAFGEDSYALYFAQPGDAEYPIADASGVARPTCPLDVGLAWAGTVRIPAGAARWDSTADAPVAVDPATTATTDIHFTIIDVERNRVYAFYTGGGDPLGVQAGVWVSGYAGCDQLHGDDGAILAASTYDIRYGCPGGGGYPPAGCGLEGLGAGVAAGQGSGSGDSNGYLGPHGVIVPQDFDDTGWSGEAVGTLHHALRCSMPTAYQWGYSWPMADTVNGDPSRHVRDGQIMRLRPSFDVVGTGAPAYEQRVMRTMQVYGCVQSDFADWGMALFALSAWPGAGLRHDANEPWSAAGMAGMPQAAIDEAVAFHAGASSGGAKSDLLPSMPMSELEFILPNGAAHY